MSGEGGDSLASDGLILLSEAEITKLVQLLVRSAFHQETDLILDDVHVWRGGGRGGRGGGAEGGHSHRGADLSAGVAVEVLIQPRIGVEAMLVVVRLVVTGV